MKKLLTAIFSFLFVFNTFACCCSLSAASDLESKKKQTKQKIKQLKLLEVIEKDKLYKNQQKLENYTTNLQDSENKIASTQKKLDSMQYELNKASSEYSQLNDVLAVRLRKIFKTQSKAFFELLVMSEDVNMFFDRMYFQGIIVKEDFDKVEAAKEKARQISLMKYNLESKKRDYERSVASMNTQRANIKRAIAKNENMINKLKTDRAAYEQAERDMNNQSVKLERYISRSAKNNSSPTIVASGFMKPIQGKITSGFGNRVHPIFKSTTFHSGVDIGGPNLGAIQASNSGKVIYAGWYGGYGKVVILEHGIFNGKPITTLYAHMSTIKVASGQQVTKGQTLGYEGTTGYSTGPHCHFEVRENGKPANPSSYVRL